MRLSILHKLLAGFLAIALIAGCAGVIYIMSLQQIQQSMSTILDRYVTLKSQADNLKFYATTQNGYMQTYMLSRDSYYGSQLLSTNDQTTKLLNEMKSLVVSKEDTAQLDYMLKMNEYYKTHAQELFNLPPAQVDQSYLDVITSVIPVGSIIVKFAQQFSDQQDALMTAAKDENTQKIAHVRQLAIAISIINFALAIIIGIFISRLISKPLQKLSKAAKSISTGDLNIEDVNVKQKDELGELAVSFNSMKNNLRHLVHEINDNASQVITISKDVASGTSETGKAAEHVADIMSDLSSSTQDQVKIVEGGLQTVYDVNKDIQQIDQSSQQAMSVAQQAQSQALLGNQEIVHVMNQMDQIHQRMSKLEVIISSLNKRSGEIEEINNAISSIAAQTGLLSLNAAIEAARAGEHGRGFAVVTSEIRKLSNETNESVDRVRALVNAIQSETKGATESVENMVKEVSQGIAAAHSVGNLFNTIKSLTDHTTSEIKEVTDSIHHLSEHSQKIVKSMENISSLTDHVASNTESVSAATEEQLAFLEESTAHTATLHSMAEKLQNTVLQFRL